MKRYAGALLIFLIPLALYGQIEDTGAGESSYTLSVSASLGFVYGFGGEFVYKNSNTGMQEQTTWDIKPLFVWGAALDFSRRDPMEGFGVFIRTDLQSGFFGKTGTTGEVRETIWTESGNTVQSSIHDNYTNGAWMVDVTTGISIPILSRLCLRLYAALDYMKFTWNGREGYKLLAGGSAVKYYGPVISYSQTWLSLAGGVSVHYPFLRFFNLGLSFQISPLIIAEAQDAHFLNKIQYTDHMSGGLFLNPRAELVFSPFKELDAFLNFSYRLIQGPQGDRDTRNIVTNSTVTTKNAAGAIIAFIDTGFGVTLRF
ncbi:MAG: omptin family outer membrane protease [Spirochaetaceae bacterium]|nr:omptin family outer membrane protease [Spirochaetaceae bacterium]